MTFKPRAPFLRSSREDGPGGGSGSDGPTTVLGAESLPSTSRIVPAEERSLPAPTDARSRGVDVEGLPDSTGGAPPAEGEAKFFSEDFNPETLPADLQGPYQAMRKQFDELSQNVPGAEVLQALRTKAEGFDRIAGSEKFKRFLDTDTPGTGVDTIPDVGDMPELEGLDDDTRKALQTIVDNAVQKRVDPIEKSFFADKATAELASCERDYGADWKKNEESIFHVMQRDNLPARKAYLQIKGTEAVALQAQLESRDTQDKLQARTVTDGAAAAASPATTRRPRNMREAMIQAEEQVVDGTAWKPDEYAHKR